MPFLLSLDMQTRRVKIEDLYEVQNCNLRCLPENYNMRYYLYHYLCWPGLLSLSEDVNGKVCGYVLGKMDDENIEDKKHGHITSLATLRTHRKLAIATKVMQKTMTEMENVQNANFCSLHVRATNVAALHLYQETLKYRCCEIDRGYYLDGEDAYHMKRYWRNKGKTQLYYVQDGQLLKEGMEVGSYAGKMAFTMDRRMKENDGKPVKGGIVDNADYSGVVDSTTGSSGKNNAGGEKAPAATATGTVDSDDDWLEGAAKGGKGGQQKKGGKGGAAAPAGSGKKGGKKGK